MDELKSYINKNKIQFEIEYKNFMNKIKDDEEENLYCRWHSKHFKSRWFLKMWKYISKYDIKIIEEILNDGNMDFIVKNMNWMLMSRLCNFNDNKFMNIFKNYISFSFAKEYNPTYKE
tara:strand:- start:1191 stop:1544 length:354 start_codon:yes stop_codon:yes gene_type:complete